MTQHDQPTLVHMHIPYLDANLQLDYSFLHHLSKWYTNDTWWLANLTYLGLKQLPPPCPLVLTYQHKRLYQQQFLGYHRQDLQVIPKKIIQAHISYNTTRWMQCICGKRECVQIVVASPIRQSPVLICWRRVSLSSDNRAEHYILSLARQWNRHVFLSSAVSEARRCLRRA